MTDHITLIRACSGYAASVTAATASAIVTFSISYGMAPWKDWGQLAIVVWLAISISALIPYLIAIWYANRQGERKWGFFACTGLVTALLGMVLLALAAPSNECGDSEGMTLAHFLGISLHFAAAGMSGGTACWLVLKSAHDEDSVPAI